MPRCRPKIPPNLIHQVIKFFLQPAGVVVCPLQFICQLAYGSRG